MSRYLERQTLFPRLIIDNPNENLGIIVVIPCHNEIELMDSFESLLNANLPKCAVEVITIINNGMNDFEKIKDQNLKTLEKALDFGNRNNTTQLKFHTIYKGDLPKKTAGVGLARKIGMDEAVRRFEKIGKPKGVIVCFDADSHCVNNYFVEIEKHFITYPNTPACTIHYEHPVSGTDFSKEIYKAIIDYELHLRYYVHIQKLIGYDYAFQTIGSSMAVRCDAYQKQGGMNKRKAGEDFYFLHKFTHFATFSELKSTKVIPSPRISSRVPFGTGRAVGEIIAENKELQTYHPQSFFDLKIFLQLAVNLYDSDIDDSLIPEIVFDFLESISWKNKMNEIRQNSGSKEAFIGRFYHWFDAFLMMKFAHFSRDHKYPNIPVGNASKIVIDILEPSNSLSSNLEFLTFFREMDKR